MASEPSDLLKAFRGRFAQEPIEVKRPHQSPLSLTVFRRLDDPVLGRLLPKGGLDDGAMEKECLVILKKPICKFRMSFLRGPVVEWLRRHSHTVEIRGSIPRGPKIPFVLSFRFHVLPKRDLEEMKWRSELHNRPPLLYRIPPPGWFRLSAHSAVLPIMNIYKHNKG